MAKLLLTIEEAAKERDYVDLFGTKHEVLNPDDFGFVQQSRMAKIAKASEKLVDGKLSDDEARSVSFALGKVIKMIVPDIAEDVLAKLKDPHRLALLQAFTEAMRTSTSIKKPGASPSTEQASQNQSENQVDELSLLVAEMEREEQQAEG